MRWTMFVGGAVVLAILGCGGGASLSEAERASLCTCAHWPEGTVIDATCGVGQSACQLEVLSVDAAQCQVVTREVESGYEQPLGCDQDPNAFF